MSNCHSFTAFCDSFVTFGDLWWRKETKEVKIRMRERWRHETHSRCDMLETRERDQKREWERCIARGRRFHYIPYHVSWSLSQSQSPVSLTQQTSRSRSLSWFPNLQSPSGQEGREHPAFLSPTPCGGKKAETQQKTDSWFLWERAAL